MLALTRSVKQPNAWPGQQPASMTNRNLTSSVCRISGRNSRSKNWSAKPKPTRSLRRKLRELTKTANVTVVDIIGPMLAGVGTLTDTEPTLKAGMIHQLDEEYFKRVEAIEFAVKYDDGKNPMGFLKADIVIVGVSRTSKTPLSMYLAHKRIKAANLPLVPEVSLPPELFQIPARKIVGLIIDPFKLNFIRSERLRSMGLDANASYANIERINEELEYARGVMRRLHCPIIDVSSKAIEETANLVMEIVKRNKELYPE